MLTGLLLVACTSRPAVLPTTPPATATPPSGIAILATPRPASPAPAVPPALGSAATPAAGASTAARPAGPLVGPGELGSINEAIKAAPAGSVIRIKAGTYREQVEVNKAVLLEPFGDGAVWIDAECQRKHGIRITAAGAGLRQLGIRRSVDAAVLIDGQSARDINQVTIEQATIHDFDCGNNGPEYRAGIGVWFAGSGHRLLNNTIVRRVELGGGLVGGKSNGIWFKSSSARPSGGGHLIAGNTIKGVWDGIGGEVEDDPHGGFDRDTIIENNTIDTCYDDGISVEGGTQNVRVRNNTIVRCAIGIANAPNLTGPVYFEHNSISAGQPGHYKTLLCFKIGDGGRGMAYYTGNRCTLTTSPGGTGWGQTNRGMNPITARDNTIHVGRYVVEISSPVADGTQFDGNCLYTSDGERFIEWSGRRYGTIEEFRAGTGQEASGRQSPQCGER